MGIKVRREKGDERIRKEFRIRREKDRGKNMKGEGKRKGKIGIRMEKGD